MLIVQQSKPVCKTLECPENVPLVSSFLDLVKKANFPHGDALHCVAESVVEKIMAGDPTGTYVEMCNSHPELVSNRKSHPYLAIFFHPVLLKTFWNYHLLFNKLY